MPTDSAPLPEPPEGYELIRTLGRGAFKEAFEAVRLDTGEHLALKRYRSKRGNWIDPRDLTINFLDLRFHHRNLLPAHRITGSWIAEPMLEVVLSFYSDADNRLPLSDVLHVADGLLEGLAFLHREGLVHGDIKPHNMGVQSDVPLLCDFGTASVFAHVTRSARDYPGTIRTRPPELHAKGVLPTPESDVWMLGASLLALLTGSYPFLTEQELASDPGRRHIAGRISARIREGEEPLHRRVLASIEPRWLAWLVCHSLRFAPHLRVTSAEFLACLRRQTPAPDRLLAGWPELRSAALKASDQDDMANVERRMSAFETYVATSDAFLQEYVIDALREDNSYCQQRCYLVLFGVTKRGLLHSSSPTFRYVRTTGAGGGRILAALLLHMDDPSRVSERQVMDAFRKHQDTLRWPFNDYGKINGSAFTAPGFRRFLREGRTLVQEARAAARGKSGAPMEKVSGAAQELTAAMVSLASSLRGESGGASSRI